MKNKILGDKRKTSFDDNLADYVNEIYDKMPDKPEVVLPPSRVVFRGISFEPKKTTDVFYFDTSLKMLRSRGFERHARPQEVFNVLIERIENPDGANIDLVTNLSYNVPEWMSLAVRKTGNILECALDPENLVWNEQNKTYEIQGENLQHYGRIKSFDIAKSIIESYDIELNKFVPLLYFKNDFVEFFYGRKFNELPLEVQKSGLIYLSSAIEGKWWPVGHQNGYGLNADFNLRASRGVREEK